MRDVIRTTAWVAVLAVAAAIPGLFPTTAPAAQEAMVLTPMPGYGTVSGDGSTYVYLSASCRDCPLDTLTWRTINGSDEASVRAPEDHNFLADLSASGDGGVVVVPVCDDADPPACALAAADRDKQSLSPLPGMKALGSNTPAPFYLSADASTLILSAQPGYAYEVAEGELEPLTQLDDLCAAPNASSARTCVVQAVSGQAAKWLVVDVRELDGNDEAQIESTWIVDRESDDATEVMRVPSDEGTTTGLDASDDGRYVLLAHQEIDDDHLRGGELLLWDRETGETERVDILPGGSPVPAPDPDQPLCSLLDGTLSADGSAVAFRAVPEAETPEVGYPAIYIRDVPSGATTLISATNDGGHPDGCSELRDISDDGSVLAFGSNATNLEGGHPAAEPGGPLLTYIAGTARASEQMTFRLRAAGVAGDGTASR